MWVSGALVVGSLLSVVVGDALVSEGQVRLGAAQAALVTAGNQQKALQVDVADKSAPPVVVSVAEGQGYVAVSQLTDLPSVPLNVPLPVPQTAPLPGQSVATGTATSPSNSTSTAGQ